MVFLPKKASFPVKCILWQYDDLMRNPLDGVNAAPLEDNLFEWHGNFYFSIDHEHFPGMVAHFILTLPQDYPNSTPDMRLLAPFPHSHVIGDTICFSLLQHWQWWFEGLPATTFWNPSRTIRSLLESLYIFLTVDEDKHVSVTDHSARDAISNSERAHCSTCGHHPSASNVWPPEENWMAAKSGSELEEHACALAMHEDIASKKYAAQLAPKSPQKSAVVMKKPRATAPPARAVVVNISCAAKPASTSLKSDITFDAHTACLKDKARGLVAKAPSMAKLGAMDQETLGDFRCSVTGATFDHSDNIVLGFGVNVERRQSDRSIASITTDLMPISLHAFAQGKIRKSALGNPFTHFFPLAINELHWVKAKRVLPGCVEAILGGRQERNISNSSQDDKLLFVIGELWKSMAVLMMKGNAHASEKVLKGFCALHHILVLASDEVDPLKGAAVSHADDLPESGSICKAEPTTESETESTSSSEWKVVVRRKKPASQDHHNGVLDLANRKVNAFVNNPWARHKAQCPDFGRFLPLILLSDLSWREIREPFIHELLARNARWIVQVHPELKRVQPHKQRGTPQRAQKSWEPSATGLKITAFQIWFALNVSSWAQGALPRPVCEAYHKLGSKRLLVRAMYDVLGGRPSKDMMAMFQQQTKEIEQLTCYEDFFTKIEMPLGGLGIEKLLCDAMLRSEKCRYHR